MRVASCVFCACSPLRDANNVEARQQKLAHVPRRDDVGKEESNNFPPYDLLSAYPKVPVPGRKVDVVLTPEDIEPLVLLDIGKVEIGRGVNDVSIHSSTEFP